MFCCQRTSSRIILSSQLHELIHRRKTTVHIITFIIDDRVHSQESMKWKFRCGVNDSVAKYVKL